MRIAGDAIPALEYLLATNTWETFEASCGEMRLCPNIPSIDAETAEVEVSSKPQHYDPSKPQPRTVDRTVFRDVMIKALPGDSISYGKSFERFEETSSGVRVFFEDGSQAEGTLLVGADGARSRIRKQLLPDIEVLDTGARVIYGKTLLTPGLVDRLAPRVMEGISGIKDRSKEHVLSMVVEPITFPNRDLMLREDIGCPQDYLYWALVGKPELMDLPPNQEPHLTAKESEGLALRLSRRWHPSVRIIVENQHKGETATLPMSSIKAEFESWEPREHATLIGDAVHPMVAAGSGAVVALQDAHTLCRLFVEDGQSKATIGKYEQEMREYASKSVAMSWQTGKVIFGKKSDDDRPIGEMMEELRMKRNK